MAASTLTTGNFNNASDVNFRAWVAAFIAAIVAGGWVQTSDTGQINTSTVTAPVAINTVAGYAIFRSNDTGGSLNEYYVKLEFGSGAVSATRPAVWATVGWASDGAGNLVSTSFPASSRQQIAVGNTPAGAVISVNMASGSGYFCICATSSLASEHFLVSVERGINTSLAFQNQVLFFGSNAGTFSFGANQAFAHVTDRLNAYPASTDLSNRYSMPPNANTPVAGVVGLGLVFGMAPGATSPSLNIFGVEDTALGVYQDTITVPVLGSNHNYKLQRGMILIGSSVYLTRFE